MSQSAAETSEPVSLDYAAPGDCPTAREFQDEVLARTGEVRFVARSATRKFQIRIERGSSEYLGTLDSHGRVGTSSHRQITGERCEAVASALAIAVALALDPRADDTLRDGPDAAGFGTTTPRIRPNGAKSRTQRVRTPERHPDRALHGHLGLDVLVEYGPAPVALVAPAPLVALEWSPTDSVTSLLHARPVLAQTGILGAAVSEAELSLYAVRTGVCPLRAGSRLRVRPCAVAEGGALRSRGLAVDVPHTSTRPWFALGLESRVDWDAGGPLFFLANASALLAATRYDYGFESPHRPFYRTRALALAFGIGAAVRIF